MGERSGFLPNFCAIGSVFAVVVVGELLVFVMVLVRPGGGSWEALSLLSLFVQWIALASAAALCLLRAWITRLPAAAGIAVSYALVLAITTVVSEIGYRLLYGPLSGPGHLGFVARSLAIAAIVAAVVLRYLYLQHEWRQRVQAAAEARIDALQARMRPHLLFNSLNTIASLIATAPATAERLVEDLADLFRASLGRSDRLVALTEELELVDGYLRMERLRLGERLSERRFLNDVPPDALIPPLTLQPLLENAVYYGIEPRVDGGTVTLAGRREADDVVIEVRNPAPQSPAGRTQGVGMAQENVRERLLLAFGRRGRLQVTEREGVYHVTVRFPYRRGTADENTHR